MAINISFFRTPKHRVFHYTPRYYDETKERIQNTLDEIEREKAEKEGRPYESKHYVPGKSIRGSMRDSEKYKKHAMKPGISKIVGWVSLIILFVMLYYFANYFGWFMGMLK